MKHVANLKACIFIYPYLNQPFRSPQWGSCIAGYYHLIYCGERKAENMTNYNALCVIDLDDFDNVEKAKEDVKQLPFILYCAKSVGGKGLFCLIRVDGSKDDYLKHWYALKDEFQTIGYKVDESCKDVSRLRFISHDENPYINYKATIYTRKKEIQSTPPHTISFPQGNETHKLTPRESNTHNRM